MDRPILIAHRGYPTRVAENTLASVAAAIDAGASHVEIDIQLSADQVPVLFHDRDMQRMCNRSGHIHQYTMEQLEELRIEDAGVGDDAGPQPLSRLAEIAGLLGRHPHVQLFVELKRISIDHFGLDTVLAQVSRALWDIEDQCVLISSSPDILIEARQQGWQTGFILKHWQQRHQQVVREVASRYLFSSILLIPEEGELDANGMELAVYDVTDAAFALDLGRRGVHFVETFSIGEMLAAFKAGGDACE